MIELLVLLLVSVILWGYLRKQDDRFPPGPTGLNIFGPLPMLWNRMDKTLRHLKKTNGPIIGVRLGTYRAVIINDAKLIREALGMKALSGRPRLNFFTDRSDDGLVRGIVPTDGPHWMEQRRFALKNLRDFGYGTKTMEAKVQDEIDELLRSFRTKQGLPIQVKHLFNRPVMNSLWSIMFGSRMENNDPESLAAFNGLATFADDSSVLRNLAIFFPMVAKIVPKLSGFEQIFQGFSSVMNFIRSQIQHHNVHYVENQPRDFVDAYKDEVKRTTDPTSSFHVKQDVMPYLLTDLFIAGGDTTSSTLSWLCAYLLHHTEVQKKLQHEIDEKIGKQRLPLLSDRPAMPYAEAVINEVMRVSSLFPLAIVHSAMDDVEFHGFLIPKGTVIIPNMYGVCYDEKIWDDPESFRPERFIDSKGFKKNENMMAFSTGKRACLGEGLAREQLFLFATNILQNFCLLPAGKLPSLEPHVSLTLKPQPFEMILKKRAGVD